MLAIAIGFVVRGEEECAVPCSLVRRRRVRANESEQDAREARVLQGGTCRCTIHNNSRGQRCTADVAVPRSGACAYGARTSGKLGHALEVAEWNDSPKRVKWATLALPDRTRGSKHKNQSTRGAREGQCTLGRCEVWVRVCAREYHVSERQCLANASRTLRARFAASVCGAVRGAGTHRGVFCQTSLPVAWLTAPAMYSV